MKIAFFETRPKEQEYLQQALSKHEIYFSKELATLKSVAKISDTQVLSIRSASNINQQIIDLLLSLKLIVTRTTGFDHIDLEASKTRRVVVCNVPAYGETTVAEYTFTLILAVARKIIPAHTQTKKLGKFYTDNLEGFDLDGKTLGVVGTGKIGAHVIKIASGFGMKIIAHDAYPNRELSEEFNFPYVLLDQLLSQADIITLHIPYLPSTHHLINVSNIERIKKGALLVNTARGAVIETTALVEALNKGVLSGAALDVLEEEKALGQENHDSKVQQIINLNQKLLQMDNVLITPHNAFNTKEARERILQTTVENIEGFTKGTPKNLV